jgi:ABC-2 type transport system ATP-binding protein
MQHEFARLVRETVAEGRTVFLSSHELDEVQRIVDRVAIIKDGQLIVTDTVDGLRKRAPRTIEFRFPAAVDPHVFAAIAGVRVIAADGGHLTLAWRGALAPVLRTAAALNPIDVIARPADLDELFLTYYRDAAPLEPNHAH